MRYTALVTGAASGIGAAIARSLRARAWVAGLDLHECDGETCDASYECDVRDVDRLTEVVASVVDQRGQIDWVVCAAGITRDRISWKMSHEEWAAVVDVNLTGVFSTVRMALPHVRESARGRVVLIGSINGVRGNVGQANYAAAKSGLVGLARTLARELGRDGVTVNCVLPGFIDTDMTAGLPEEVRERALARTPLARFGAPEDVAHLVEFLCSDGADFITGAAVPVDGGQLMGAC